MKVFPGRSWCCGEKSTSGAGGDGKGLFARGVILAFNLILKGSAFTYGALLKRNQTHLFTHVDGEHRDICWRYTAYSRNLPDGFWFQFLKFFSCFTGQCFHSVIVEVGSNLVVLQSFDFLGKFFLALYVGNLLHLNFNLLKNFGRI